MHSGLCCYRLCIILVVAWWGVVGNADSLRDYEQLPFALHVHSRFSDGTETVSHIVAKARAAGYRGVLITDHSDSFLEYPFHGILLGYHRSSIREHGFRTYLNACRHVAAANPDMTLVPGVEASPYYYWSGDAIGARVVLLQWKKHLVVFGVEDPDRYYRLPMTAYHNSNFPPGFVDAGEQPYRDFVHAVAIAGGVAYWAHPDAASDEHVRGQVYSHVDPYATALLTVPESGGIAVTSVADAITQPGGIWDQATLAYCRGQRPTPAWGFLDIDYHQGVFPAQKAVMVLRPTTVAQATDAHRVAVEQALRDGHFYLTAGVPGTVILEECVLIATDGNMTIPGGTIHSHGPHTLRYAIRGRSPLSRIHIIRNGEIVADLTSLSGEWCDTAKLSAGQHGYYRLVVQFANGDFILTNPMFYFDSD